MDDNGGLKRILERAATYILETSVRESTTGNHVTFAESMPKGIILYELFERHMHDIADILLEYEAVAEITTKHDCIDMML